MKTMFACSLFSALLFAADSSRAATLSWPWATASASRAPAGRRSAQRAEPRLMRYRAWPGSSRTAASMRAIRSSLSVVRLACRMR